ncbi:MAG: ABC transporter substrate-binding protein, partial [Aeromicrobium sp.]
MKKFLGLLAAVVMMFALSACGDSATTGSAAKDKEKVEVGEKAEVKLTEDNFFDVL